MTAGYHLTPIMRGSLGGSSKIMEELLELIDAEQQGVRLMQLQELSDVVGAIQAYLKSNFPEFSMLDLITMAEVTRRAFESGQRS